MSSEIAPNACLALPLEDQIPALGLVPREAEKGIKVRRVSVQPSTSFGFDVLAGNQSLSQLSSESKHGKLDSEYRFSLLASHFAISICFPEEF